MQESEPPSGWELDPAPCPCCGSEPLNVMGNTAVATAECKNKNRSVLQYEAYRR